MAPNTKDLTNMLGQLTDREQWLVFELISRLLPDDIATPDDIAAHNAAIADYSNGETFSDDDINWD